MRRITVGERRARLGVRHRLAPSARAAGPAEAAESVVALHGTDAASVYVSAWARTKDGDVAGVERALYEEHALLRLLGMRRTQFVTPPHIAAVIQVASSRAVAAQERRRLLGLLAANGIGGRDPQGWLAGAEEAALAALAARGVATATEIAEDDPRLAAEVVLAPGKRYQARQKVASRLLTILGADGKIVRVRPRGGWTSHQYRWAPLEHVLPGGFEPLTEEEARGELARRWLESFGPGTVEDLRWWTGWTKTQTTRALAGLRPVEVELDGGGTGLVLPGDLEPVAAPEPWAALLPALDATPMGWKERDWYVGGHSAELFDLNGNIGPSAWWEGRIVGCWAQDRDGRVVVRFLEDVGREAEAAVRAEADRLAPRLGTARLTPRARGRIPLERELADGSGRLNPPRAGRPPAVSPDRPGGAGGSPVSGGRVRRRHAP